MNTSREHLLDWLRDAHAMELQSERLLKGEDRRIDHYPELKRQLEVELALAQGHQDKLKAAIDAMGGSTSVIKEAGARLVAWGQVASGLFVSDEVVKSVMSLYVFSNLEVASYTILIEAATHHGDETTRSLCESIRDQKTKKAQWLFDYLPRVTQEFLIRANTGHVPAKR